MSGHSRFSMAKEQAAISEALGGQVAVENMIQFCTGYILALEDILEDIDAAYRDFLVREMPAVDKIAEMVKRIRDEASVTLASVAKKLEQPE